MWLYGSTSGRFIYNAFDVTVLDWLIAIFFGVLCVVSLSQFRKLWRHKTTFWDGKAPSWWFWGESLYRGWVRSQIVMSSACAFLLIGAVTSELANTELVQTTALASFVLFVALFALGLSVMLFNRPRVFVPPYLRGESGAIVHWWRSRQRRRMN